MLIDTNGGTLGAVSCPGPPHPLASTATTASGTTRRIRIVPQSLRRVGLPPSARSMSPETPYQQPTPHIHPPTPPTRTAASVTPHSGFSRAAQRLQSRRTAASVAEHSGFGGAAQWLRWRGTVASVDEHRRTPPSVRRWSPENPYQQPTSHTRPPTSPTRTVASVAPHGGFGRGARWLQSRRHGGFGGTVASEGWGLRWGDGGGGGGGGGVMVRRLRRRLGDRVRGLRARRCGRRIARSRGGRRRWLRRRLRRGCRR